MIPTNAEVEKAVKMIHGALAAKVARLQDAHDQAFNSGGVGPTAGQVEEYNAALRALLTREETPS